MSYADRLQKLVEYQTNIRSALEAKGATISSDATLKDFPSAVDTITGDYTGPTPVDFVENGMGAYVSMMSNATKIASQAFYYNQDITEASFPRVSIIGGEAFCRASNLNKAYFPNVISVNSSAFVGCNNLSTISFPKCKFLGANTFYQCSKLKDVYLPEAINIMGGAFESCSQLTNIELPKYTGSITTATFSACYSLKNVSMPVFSGVLSYYTFNSCYKLESIYVPFVTGVSAACFSYCSSLSILSLPNLKTIGSSGFTYARGLLKLYLYSDTIVKLSTADAFDGSPISYSRILGRFGSVFVKYGLLDSYKSSTNWVKYADRLAVEIPFSATNLSESDSITVFVEGKESPVPLEVPSAEFTYSVYSKYPKYTGTQADMNENEEINISLPTDGVTLTVNTTPEDATVRITEDGIVDIYTKTKILNSGDTVDYMAYTPINESIPYYYGEKHNTVTVNDDEVFEVKLSRKGYRIVNAGNVYSGVSELKTNILNMFSATAGDFVSVLNCENSAFESGYFAYTTPSIPIKLSFTVFAKGGFYPSYSNIVLRISTVLDENTYSNYRNLSSASVLQDGNVLCVDVSESEKEYEIELEPNTTYYFQELYACYGANSLGSKKLMYIKGINLYEDLGNCVLLTASNSEKVYGLVNGKLSEGMLLPEENEEFSYTAYSEGKPKITGTQSDVNEEGEVNVVFPETGISLEVNSEIPGSYISITQDGVWTEYNTTTMVNNGDEVTVEHFNPFYENYSITQTLSKDTGIMVNGLNMIDSGNILSVDVAKWYPETRNMSVTKLKSGSMYLAIQGDEIPLAGDYKAYMIEITCPIKCSVGAIVVAGIDTGLGSGNRNIIRFSETPLDIDNADIWSNTNVPSGCIDLVNSVQAYDNGTSVRPVGLSPNKKYYLYIYSRRINDKKADIDIPAFGLYNISFTKIN